MSLEANTLRPPCALLMAAGTGGHIFPALAVADLLKGRGWRIAWLGASQGLERQLVPEAGYSLFSIPMRGVRGQSLKRRLRAPLMLMYATWRAFQHLRFQRPDVAVGFGGYVSFPGALAARCLGIPLLIHEQNAIAGMANRWIRRFATEILQAFPNAFGTRVRATTVGNPVRDSICSIAEPTERFAAREGPLRLLVLGGSQGAQRINQVVPEALARIAESARPMVLHQAGQAHVASVRAAYQQLGVAGEVVAFIADMAQALGEADVVLGRAGALTVSELAAAGVAAILVPFPAAVDDHQTKNAHWLSEAGAAWLIPQSLLEAGALAQQFNQLTRPDLCTRAQKARELSPPDAAARVADACQAAVEHRHEA